MFALEKHKHTMCKAIVVWGREKVRKASKVFTCQSMSLRLSLVHCIRGPNMPLHFTWLKKECIAMVWAIKYVSFLDFAKYTSHYRGHRSSPLCPLHKW
jgi:hypothetical protein